MNFYRASGSDPSSDDGYWEVVVQARDKRQAKNRIIKHLQSFNKPYLLEDLMEPEKVEIDENGLVHSNVQG